MSVDQLQILGILIAFAGMFLSGRWRHDLVAAGALLACAKVGMVAPADAFDRIAHPAAAVGAAGHGGRCRRA